MLDWINVVIFAITMSFSSQTGELPVDVDKVVENIEYAPFYDESVTPSEDDDTLVGRITDWVSANMDEFSVDENDTSAVNTNYQTFTANDSSDTGSGMFALANPRILTTAQYNAMTRAIPQNLIYSDALEIVIGIEPRTKSSFLKSANAEIVSIRTPAGAELLDDEYVATGDYLTKSGSSILYRVVIFGDVDFDGLVTSADAELIKRAYEETITLTPPALYAANVDWSGQDSITPLDYDIVREYILNQKPIKQDHDVDFTSTQPEYAGEQLSGNELNAYKRMIKNYQNMDLTADYSQFNLTEVQFNKVYGSFYADFPELVWFANAPTVNLSGGVISIVQFNYKYSPFEKDSMVLEIEAVQDSFLDGIEKFDNDYERYKFIHNKIITSCAYNLDSLTYTNPSEFKNEGDIYGALVQKSPSNEGYTRAFQYICKLAGLECLYVVGDKEITTDIGTAYERHSWNLIPLDGKYYNVDLTSDDPIFTGVGDDGHDPRYIECVSYSFMNVTDAKMAENKIVSRHSSTAYNVDANTGECYYQTPAIATDRDNTYFAKEGVFFASLAEQDVDNVAKLTQHILKELNKGVLSISFEIQGYADLDTIGKRVEADKIVEAVMAANNSNERDYNVVDYITYQALPNDEIVLIFRVTPRIK